MSAGDALARLRQALADHGCNVRGSSAQCPGPDHANGDRNHSLSIDQGRDGAVLNCHRGCTTDAILEALGMSAADLFDEQRQRGDRTEWTPWRDRCECGIAARYPYTDENGELLFEAVRGHHKEFAQRRPDSTKKSGWRWSISGVRLVLYQLPAVIEAVKNGEPVYVAEGEKDVHAIEAAGAVATCNPMGAGKWRDEYARFLAGADVIIIADRDKPGREHAAAVAASLGSKARSVRIVEAAVDREKADASDHLAAGHTLAELVPITLPAPDTDSPQAADSEPDADPVTARLGQLRAALLTSDTLGTIEPPRPVIDGLLYRDGLAWLYGKPGTYKSIIAIDWACCVSVGLPWQDHETAQGPVLYVYIEGVPGLEQRVRAWEDRAGCKSQAAFLPVAVQLMNAVDNAAVRMLIGELRPVLVVLDTQARVTVGVEENSATEMGRVVDAAAALARVCGSCVLLIHHEGRSGETPRGSIAIDGAATSMFRTDRDGDRIAVKNTRQRDTAEADDLLLYAVEHLGSVVVVNVSQRWEFGPPREGSDTKILAIMREVFAGISASPTQLIDASGLSRSTVYRTLSSLVRDGKVVNTGTSKRPLYECVSGNVSQLPMAPAAGTSQIPTPGGSFRTPGGGNFGTRPADNWPEGSIGEEENQ